MSEVDLNDSKTILVVDDEPAMRALVVEILRIHGYTVFESQNLLEALDVLKRESVSLVVSDVVMSGGDGFQLAETLGSQYPDIKILLVSGYNEYIGQNVSVEILNKPFKSVDLLLKVNALIGEI